MKVSEFMSRDVETVSPDEPIQAAARQMRDRDIGSIPVAENDRLIGMVTDRDIVIRCLAGGQGADAPVRSAMTTRIRYCFDDENLADIARNMSDERIRRLPVVNRDKRLVGIVSLGDVARSDDRAAGAAMEHIVANGGAHHDLLQAGVAPTAF